MKASTESAEAVEVVRDLAVSSRDLASVSALSEIARDHGEVARDA
jgi:hypothetical protein